MKNLPTLLILIVLVTSFGCQNPCTQVTSGPLYAGDTTYIKRNYATCGDTLNYYQWRMKRDSTVLEEGEVLNGLKEGDWTVVIYGQMHNVITYRAGNKVAAKMYGQDGALLQEEELLGDSIFRVRSYYEESGQLEAEGYQTLDDYTTGHWVEYDTLGRKVAEGDHIAEPCLTDTMYIESPLPPHDLQMTVITESGGRHGPWLFYDGEGSVSDTVIYDHGIPVIDGANTNSDISTEQTGNDGSAVIILTDPEKKSPPR
ncbi:MAG: hypothetical protein EP314_02980 [Bacteroidetes bacterium]|nr:MAG: hypothetical protein EP314_02980 [Bacteroidota bacterium]